MKACKQSKYQNGNDKGGIRADSETVSVSVLGELGWGGGRAGGMRGKYLSSLLVVSLHQKKHLEAVALVWRQLHLHAWRRAEIQTPFPLITRMRCTRSHQMSP